MILARSSKVMYFLLPDQEDQISLTDPHRNFLSLSRDFVRITTAS